ncbi:hypothetical protein GCM10009096_10520 [Parasphingorhabdus litoris]|uniref:Helix-turn-helix domain-containing protein n=1 Tax=Parasphingorhabdus litoris TaxID=394733 RepID=A0ABN1AA57_9SPHN|nr:hypothetical protein [Parasphingorhabdus litoris]
MSGFIKLYRGWSDCDLFKNEPFCERAAWVWLIENAAWKETMRYNYKGEMIPLERGQIHVSLASLESVFGWSKKRIRGFLDRLEKGHMAVTNRAQSGTVLTICNYDKYQNVQHTEGHSQGTVKGTAGAQSGHTQEEGKEIKEEKKSARGSRLSSDWKPDDECRAYAREERGWGDPTIDAVGEDFRDHWIGASGNNAIRSDWSAAWRKWVRNDRRPDGNTLPKESERAFKSDDQWNAWCEERAARASSEKDREHWRSKIRRPSVPLDPGIHPVMVPDVKMAEAPDQKRSSPV